jgi:hypothetical protein
MQLLVVKIALDAIDTCLYSVLMIEVEHGMLHV